MLKKLIIIFILVSSLFSATAYAWDDCPYGEVNDEYPGDCARYVDTDEDGICDHSQPAPEDRNIDEIASINEKEIHDLVTGQELKKYTVTEIAEVYKINPTKYTESLSDYYKVTINESESFQLLHDNYGVEPSIAKDIAVSIKTGQEIVVADSEKTNNNESTYHLFPISLILIFLYAITKVLSKKKILSVINHKKIWNVLLLFTFFIVGILSVLLIIRINFHIAITLPFNILFWHVEFGIAMLVICTLHIIERRYYFLSMLKPKKHNI